MILTAILRFIVHCWRHTEYLVFWDKKSS